MSSGGSKPKSLLEGPTLVEYSDTSGLEYPEGKQRPGFALQYSIHDAPSAIVREFCDVFPEGAAILRPKKRSALSTGDRPKLLAISTMQPCGDALIAWSDASAREKDEKLENFLAWSQKLSSILSKSTQDDSLSSSAKSTNDTSENPKDVSAPTTRVLFADFVDPCSGLAAMTRASSSVYNEVLSAQSLLKYHVDNVGQCHVIRHPTWGTGVYPATFFAIGSFETVLKAIEQIGGKAINPSDNGTKMTNLVKRDPEDCASQAERGGEQKEREATTSEPILKADEFVKAGEVTLLPGCKADGPGNIDVSKQEHSKTTEHTSIHGGDTGSIVDVVTTGT